VAPEVVRLTRRRTQGQAGTSWVSDGRRVYARAIRRVYRDPQNCVHGERLNGVLRDRLNALTRRTHALAKRADMWDALVVACVFEHNWIRPHPALRERVEGLPGGRRYRQRTPAMAMGLTDHVWSWAASPLGEHWEEFLTFRCYQYLRE